MSNLILSFDHKLQHARKVLQQNQLNIDPICANKTRRKSLDQPKIIIKTMMTTAMTMAVQVIQSKIKIRLNNRMENFYYSIRLKI
ncbi:hypothetical protein BpHYR1_003423 [Brachionus plicatilis]|uniref:Uncharacterized protein n=1 Tax=Brachionus plicatilis TaxID=10195 RepID=A0A3M7RJV5_BRAPC|nr:hypothetical protein BpHYR1_003423 [Brachionus plicatilis]